MNRYLTFFLLLLASSSSCIDADDLDDTVLTFSAGYRRDSLCITAKNHEGHANVIDKHSWDDVGIWDFGFAGWTFTEYNLFFKGKAHWGKVVCGHEKVEAPLIPEESFHQHNVQDSFTYDASIAIGFPVFFTCVNNSTVIPLIGYSWDHLELGSHGHLFTGPMTSVSLKTHDHNFWLGPWAGVDINFPFWCCWHFYGSYEYHWGHLRSQGKFKQDTNFAYKFHQKTNGIANVGRLGIGYQFWDDWDALFTVNYTNWHSHGGHNRIRFINAAGTETTTRTKLKTSEWTSWGFQLDLNLLF